MLLFKIVMGCSEKDFILLSLEMVCGCPSEGSRAQNVFYFCAKIGMRESPETFRRRIHHHMSHLGETLCVNCIAVQKRFSSVTEF